MAELLPNWLQENCYPAQYDRLMLGNLVCSEGVADVGGGSLLVTTGGSGLEVDVAQGGGWVEGDDDDRGMYSIYNDAPVTLTATAANPTNPRIDQVIARVYDSTYGEGSDEWVLEMLDGTATGGATLTNLNGAASLPDNAIRLAYVLVPATFVGPFVNATHILDGRTPYGSCDTYQSVVPTFTNTMVVDAAGTQGRLAREGDTITYNFEIRFDAGGSGTWDLDLPVPARSSISWGMIGAGFFRAAASGSVDHLMFVVGPTTDVARMIGNADTSVYSGAAANDDILTGTLIYEADLP